MTDRNTFELTRRKALAALGSIGAASAAGALGTSAYFSDTEQFPDNQLVAGSLDLKVDWEEHYYDGSGTAGDLVEPADPADADYLLPGVQPAARLRNGDYPPSSRVGSLQLSDDVLPIALDFVDEDTDAGKDAFWDATSIEAYPDVDDDGIQEAFDETYQVGGNGMEITVGEPCVSGADAPEDLDPTPVGAFRTENEDTVTEGGDPRPLVAIDDVKPGDFGEVTLSMHLCDNPGYLWLTGELVGNAENGVTEAEANDPDEDDGTGVANDDAGDQWSGELADNVMTRLWYDRNCDNQVDDLAGELDLVLAVDTSGSIRGDERQQMRDGVNTFIDQLPTDGSVQVGTLTFGDDQVANVQGMASPGAVAVSLPSFGGNTPLPAALDVADQVLRNDPNGNARSGAEKAVVVFTDGGPNYESRNYFAGPSDQYEAPRGTDEPGFSADAATDGYDAGTVDSAVDESEMAETATVADSVRGAGTRVATVFVGSPGSTDAMTSGAVTAYTSLPKYLADEVASNGFSFTVDLVDLGTLATQLVETIVVGEEVFFLGTLSQALAALSAGNGIPLDADTTTAFDEVGGDPAAEGRECFDAGTTHCVGFEWWLPLDHANQIQTDSVAFDLGVYTEQCRHNSGGGIVPETTAGPEPE